jgi:xanthine dehydrogenase molybdopterin-binding subunit B
VRAGRPARPGDRARNGLIGAPVSRLDGPLKVRGAAAFAAEFSPIPKGRIANLDISAADQAPGVVLVMTYRNAPRLQPMPLFMSADKAAGGSDLPIPQYDKIYWNGQPIAVVLAETQEQANHAKSLIRVTYEAPNRRPPRSRRPKRTAPSPNPSRARRSKKRSVTPRRRWPPHRTEWMPCTRLTLQLAMIIPWMANEGI